MRKNELKIYLASPRGFCAGVDRAIEIVKKSIDKFGSPVYVGTRLFIISMLLKV